MAWCVVLARVDRLLGCVFAPARFFAALLRSARGQSRDAALQLRDLSNELMAHAAAAIAGPSSQATSGCAAPTIVPLCARALMHRAHAIRTWCGSTGDEHHDSFRGVPAEEEAAWTASAGAVVAAASAQGTLSFNNAASWDSGSVVGGATALCSLADREINMCMQTACALQPHRANWAYEYASFLYDAALRMDGDASSSSSSSSSSIEAQQTLFDGALHNYFEFLRLSHHRRGSAAHQSTPEPGGVGGDATNAQVRAPAQETHADHVVSATLRILRLLVKFPDRLRSTFVAAFPTTPLLAWEHILPQLCSRLRHPNSFVSSQVRALLLRIATDNPHKLLPTLVADTVSNIDNNSNNVTTANNTAAVVGVGSSSVGNNSNNKNNNNNSNMAEGIEFLKSDIRRRHQSLVFTTERLFLELAGIAVLWEDRWLRCVLQVRSDFQPRYQRFAHERRRVFGSKSSSSSSSSAAAAAAAAAAATAAASMEGLMSPPASLPVPPTPTGDDADGGGAEQHELERVVGEKFVTLMRPLARALQKLCVETFGDSVEGLTAHERRFARQFYARIAHTSNFFATPHYKVGAVRATLLFDMICA